LIEEPKSLKYMVKEAKLYLISANSGEDGHK